MKPIITIICLFIAAGTANAQAGAWTWMRGDTTFPSFAVYGTQGVAAPSNTPPSLYESAEWTDLNGNFWIYGGFEFIGPGGLKSALWKFDPVTNLWTWVSGSQSSNVLAVHGTKGVPSPLNDPGNRGYGIATWVDLNNDLWMFGGNSWDPQVFTGLRNDMWKYSIATNEWTWMSGSDTVNGTGVPGVLQVPDVNNTPSPRCEAGSTWTDANGDLWMFGGTNTTDEVWRYSVATNEWTWMSGQTTGITGVNYGVQGVPAATNTPGARFSFSNWKDQQGNFWIYGGGNTGYSDMWMYNPTTFMWTWMAGTGLTPLPVFSTYCTPGQGVAPPLTENRACWTDQCGRFWQFGGFGFGSDLVNILWVFDPVTLEFTWVSGSLAVLQPAIAAAQFVPSVSNVPASADGGNGFTALNGDLWMTGGRNAGTLLWRYQIDPSCPSAQITATIAASAQNGTGCAPFTPSFSALLSNAQITTATYQWDFGDPTTTNDTSSLANPAYTFSQPGTYTVTLIASAVNSCINSTDTSTFTVTVFQQPIANLGSDTVLCSPASSILLDAGNTGATFLWSTNDTTQTIQVNSPGIYSVTISEGSCISADTLLISIATQPDLGNDTAVCPGQSLQLATNAPGNYLWNTGDTTSSILATTAGAYILQVFDAVCITADTLVLTLLPAPVVDLGNDTLLCPDQTLILNAANTNASYNWNTGANSAAISINQAGNYSVIVNQAGCVAADSIRVTYTTTPQLGDDLSLCLIENNIVLDAGTLPGSYRWSTGDTTSSITISEPGIYSLTVTSGSCILTDSITITGNPGGSLLYVPNSFTPNGDGLNDNFKPIGTDIISFNLLIFNRWGELIFETNDYNSGWNGITGNQQAENEVYVYLINYSSSCSEGLTLRKMGHVSVIR
ncbi:MAG: gliding motility-associated C-terminal domain-containing protein [Bacteroidia bacterium]|jgi:gliding motility-associated-like protein|nr:gliding motility-associated C-terminal domain-containing protein [Bacteroidia bacterium]